MDRPQRRRRMITVVVRAASIWRRGVVVHHAGVYHRHRQHQRRPRLNESLGPRRRASPSSDSIMYDLIETGAASVCGPRRDLIDTVLNLARRRCDYCSTSPATTALSSAVSVAEEIRQ